MKKMVSFTLLCLLLFLPGCLRAQILFDGPKAFILMLKHKGGGVEQYIDEYVYRFNNKNYNSFQEDEFEFAKTIADLKATVGGSPNDGEFYVTYTSQFGKYNFENSEFEFNPLSDETYLEIVNYLFAPRLKTNTSISLKFYNGTEINSLPMPYDNANFLIKMRKDKRTGDVDRKIHLKIYFNLAEYSEFSDVSETKKKVTLFAYITHVEAYESADFLSNPLSNIPTEYLNKKESEKAKAAAEDEKKTSELNAVNSLNNYLANEKVDKELKAKIMKTAIDYYAE